MVEEPRLLGPGDEVGDIEDGGDGAYGVLLEAPQGRRRRGLLLRLLRRRFLGRLLLHYCFESRRMHVPGAVARRSYDYEE